VTDNPDIPEGYKATELGVLPKEWDAVPLSDILIERDIRLRDLKKEEHDSFQVLSLTKKFGLILQSDRFEKRIATVDVGKYKVVNKGQIVYNPYVIWEGAVHILRYYEKGLVSPVYPVWQAKIEKANPFFVDHNLRTPYAIREYNRLAAGAVNRRRSIRKSDFLKIKILLPPLPEQHAIAATLRTVQEAKEKTDAVIVAMKAIKASMMKHLLTYGPVPPGEAETVALKETEIGPVPVGWEVSNLGEKIIEKIINGAFIRPDNFGHGVPFLNVVDVYPTLYPNYDKLDKVEIPEKYLNRFCLKNNDLLYVRSSLKREGIAQCCIVKNPPKDAIFDCHLMRVRVDTEQIFPEYLAHYSLCLNARGQLISLSKTTTMTTINQQNLSKFQVLLPPLEIQQQIANILSSFDQKLAAEQSHRQALETLFTTLLHDLMTAKIRVNGV